MRSPMFSNLGSALRNANAESALYRRWFPGAGQRGGGFAGMGQDITGEVTSTDPIPTLDQAPPLPTDLPTTPIIPITGPSDIATLQACSEDPNCTLPPGIDPSMLYADPGYNITGVTPGAPLTPAQLAAQQTQAQADLLKLIPTTAAIASTLANSGLALTAAQIAAGVSAGTVQAVPTTTCPSGYRYSTGTCVPGSAAGQWFSFATNTQVLTFGAVILGALIIIPALSGGGGGRRRR